MIYWKISYCKQLARCSLLAQLLFTWLIPNTDDLGRMEGDPEIIKGMIFPYHHKIKLLPDSKPTELTIEIITAALQELKDQCLIIWYQVSDCLYVAFPKFNDYQKLRKDRAYDSDYPSPATFVPTCHDMAGLDGQNMREVKRSEGEVKEKGSEGECMHGENIPPCQPVIQLILNDKSEYPVYQEQIDGWGDLYESVDIMQELKKMKGWLDANIKRRKTKQGIQRFINSWLSKEQDKGKKNSDSNNPFA